jgi:hypothetical protein
MSWTDHANDTLKMFLENIIAEGRLAERFGIDASSKDIIDASSDALQDVIHRGLPMARLMDDSDLVLHAEGPAVRGESPMLSAFSWMAGTVQASLRELSRSIFDLLEKDAKRLSRNLDLRVTGTAPGSLYMGFAIGRPEGGLFVGDREPVIAHIRDTVHTLPSLSLAIGDDEISPSAVEIVPDAAERDSSLAALLRLAPTGKRGIHTVDIAAPGFGRGTLSQRERVVLTDALRMPTLANKRYGTFVGEIRQIDLDTRRMHLRNVTGVGSLRCALPILDLHQAKLLIGEQVRAEGEYEVDRSGRPRLLLVQRIDPTSAPEQPRLI